MSVDPTDWQCCGPTTSGLRCTKPLIYGKHEGECEHEHDYRLIRPGETYCGCPDTNRTPDYHTALHVFASDGTCREVAIHAKDSAEVIGKRVIEAIRCEGKPGQYQITHSCRHYR